jgi:hypothetical protein
MASAGPLYATAQLRGEREGLVPVGQERRPQPRPHRFRHLVARRKQQVRVRKETVARGEGQERVPVHPFHRLLHAPRRSERRARGGQQKGVLRTRGSWRGRSLHYRLRRAWASGRNGRRGVTIEIVLP